MKKAVNKGIILITTLLIITFVVMFAGAVLVSSRQSMLFSNDFYEREMATQAAISGLSYARQRLEATNEVGVTWQGTCQQSTTTTDAEGDEVTVTTYLDDYTPEDIDDTTGFTVIEHHESGGKGWVEGKIYDSSEDNTSSPTSKFFIYFDPPSPLTFDDPDVGEVTARYCSVNNMNSASATTNTDASGNYYREVPPFCANIIVQGICGDAEKHIEVLLLKLPDEDYDSVGISHGDMDITMNNTDALWFITSQMLVPPRVRSKGKINVKVTSLFLTSDFVEMATNGYGRANGTVEFETTGPEDSSFTPQSVGFMEKVEEDQENHIPDLSWSNMTRSETTAVDLPAGTYTFTKNDNGDLVVKYSYTGYDSYGGITNYEEGYYWKSAPSSNTLKEVFEFEENEEGEYEAYNVNVVKPINVTKQGASKDIEFKCDDSIDFELTMNLASTENESVYIYNAEGDVKVSGQLAGTGAVYAKDDIYFIGKSQLTADSGQVCVYAGGDIYLNQFSKGLKTSPYGNPSRYIAQAIKEYLVNEVEADKDEYKKIKIGDIWKKIEDYEMEFEFYYLNTITDEYELAGTDFAKLKDILEKEIGDGDGCGYEYDEKKREELILSMLIDNADKQKGKHLYYKESLETDGAFDQIINDPETATTSIKPTDQILKGVVYSHDGNFTANLGQDSLTIQGALIAKNGNIDINAGKVTFNYDPRYLGPIYELGNYSYRQIYWTTFGKSAGDL